MNHSLTRLASCLIALVVLQTERPTAEAAPRGSVIPGTGTLIEYVGDDFENDSWGFINNFPKSSREQDSRVRRQAARPTGDGSKGPSEANPTS